MPKGLQLSSSPATTGSGQLPRLQLVVLCAQRLRSCQCHNNTCVVVADWCMCHTPGCQACATRWDVPDTV